MRSYGWPIAGALLAAATITVAAIHRHERSSRDIASLGRSYFYSDENSYVKRGPFDEKIVYMTIDDGPHPKSILSILATLKSRHARATFFLVGKRVDEHPEIVRRILRDGFEVGNHTQDHFRLDTLTPKQIDVEIEQCEEAVYKAAGVRMKLFRPPGMHLSRVILAQLRSHGYITVGYTTGAKDFVGKEVSPAMVTDRVLDHVEPGSILLLHDDPFTAAAMPSLLDDLGKQGYRVCDVSQLLANLDPPIKIAANPRGVPSDLRNVR